MGKPRTLHPADLFVSRGCRNVPGRCPACYNANILKTSLARTFRSLFFADEDIRFPKFRRNGIFLAHGVNHGFRCTNREPSTRQICSFRAAAVMFRDFISMSDSQEVAVYLRQPRDRTKMRVDAHTPCSLAHEMGEGWGEGPFLHPGNPASNKKRRAQSTRLIYCIAFVDY